MEENGRKRAETNGTEMDQNENKSRCKSWIENWTQNGEKLYQEWIKVYQNIHGSKFNWNGIQIQQSF